MLDFERVCPDGRGRLHTTAGCEQFLEERRHEIVRNLVLWMMERDVTEFLNDLPTDIPTLIGRDQSPRYLAFSGILFAKGIDDDVCV